MPERWRPARPSAPLPRHPMLRPGVRVCQRGDGLLQVGLVSALALRLPDTGELRTVLVGMRDGAALPPLNSLHPSTARACLDMWSRGLLVDADDLLTTLGETDEATTRQVVSDLFTRGGTGSRWRAREAARIEIRDQHLPAAADLLASLLSGAGVTLAAAPQESDLVVLLTNGVADRSGCDQLMRRDQPHVLLTCVEGSVEVGPFVEPGTSTCLRCVDAHRAERDPQRELVLTQYLDAPPTVAPDPVPHDLVTLAVGALAREVTRWVDGEQPTTWSATLHVDPTLALRLQRWPRHPSCGCNWDELYAV